MRPLFWNMAGAAGFEPARDGIKTRCLTAWLRPNKLKLALNYQLSIEKTDSSKLRRPLIHPFIKGRTIAAFCYKPLPLIGQLLVDRLRLRFGIEGGEDAAAGSGHLCLGKLT